jgi:hypothetical protein
MSIQLYIFNELISLTLSYKIAMLIPHCLSTASDYHIDIFKLVFVVQEQQPIIILLRITTISYGTVITCAF